MDKKIEWEMGIHIFLDVAVVKSPIFIMDPKVKSGPLLGEEKLHGWEIIKTKRKIFRGIFAFISNGKHDCF